MLDGNEQQLRVASTGFLKNAAEKREDGATLNQFIVTAVAEKLSALRTAEYFVERATRGDLKAFDAFMGRDGGEAPRAGDEVPAKATSP